MPLQPGTTLGPYQVIAKIGEGGMGEVWQARDTKLDRDVALKVLPEAFTSDPDRLARFEREAKVLASLNHPNIGSIYGLEEAEGVRALVLELVEGPTLADRIKQGPIPLDEALPIAKQIVDALEAAHEQGVIHRDLKPANIKVREDGTMKVLDFGLAKAFQPDAGDASASMSPTISLSAAATQMGMVIGTAAYMAPEQAKGLTVDKRADIWAYGAVLFEMLTGKKLFDAGDVSEMLASVLVKDPDISAIGTHVPAHIRSVVRQCLVKDPKERLRDIGDVRLAMKGAFEAPLAGAATGSARRRKVEGWLVAGLIITIGVSVLMFFAGMGTGRSPEASRVGRFVIPTEDLAPISADSPGLDLTLSPDGSQIIYRDNFVGGEGQLNVRPLDELRSQRLEGAVGATDPFVSPDGQWIGFMAAQRRTLMKVPMRGGRSEAIAEAPAVTRGAYWAADGSIIFGSALGLFRIAPEGGAPERLTTLEEEGFHGWPFWFIRDLSG